MTQPMTGEQRAELRAHWQSVRLFPGPAKEARDAVLRLLDELDRVHFQEPLGGAARRTSAPRVPLPPPTIDDTWADVSALEKWLDASDADAGFSFNETLLARVLKLNEEAGEAAAALIGALGQNPRKGVTHTMDDVAAELIDTAVSAMVALATVRKDAPQRFAIRLKETVERTRAQEPSPAESDPVSAE